MFTQGRIIIFAKAPTPGEVKTRLIPALGAHRAAELHAQLMERTLSLCSAVRSGTVELWCAPDTAHPFFQQCGRNHDLDLYAQAGGDLGERMYHALESTLKRAAYAVLVGSDCASLTSDLLRQVCAALHGGMEAVIAPAEDGGYVLLGLRRVAADLFTAMPWGTDQVMENTRRRLERLDWRWQELPVQWDVDRPEDLARLARLPEFTSLRVG